MIAIIGIVCGPYIGAIAASGIYLVYQNNKQQTKQQKMNRIKTLLAALVAALKEIINTPRADVEALKAQAETYRQQASELQSELASERAQEQEEDTQQQQDENDLAAVLEEALATAAAAKPPTEEHLVEAQNAIGNIPANPAPDTEQLKSPPPAHINESQP